MRYVYGIPYLQLPTVLILHTYRLLALFRHFIHQAGDVLQRKLNNLRQLRSLTIKENESSSLDLAGVDTPSRGGVLPRPTHLS